MAWVYKVLEVLSGLILATILWLIFPPVSTTEGLLNALAGITFSLLVTFVGESVRTKRSMDAGGRLLRELISLASSEGVASPVFRLFARSGIAYLAADRFPNVYLDILWSISHSYDTTMVICDDDINAGHNRQALEIQRAKIAAAGVTIRRIFITKEVTSQALTDFLARQHDAGIRVFTISDAKVKRNAILKSWLRKVDSIDFSIIDRRFTLTTVVDPRTLRIGRFRISAEPSEREVYEEFFASLMGAATEYHSTPPPAPGG